MRKTTLFTTSPGLTIRALIDNATVIAQIFGSTTVHTTGVIVDSDASSIQFILGNADTTLCLEESSALARLNTEANLMIALPMLSHFPYRAAYLPADNCDGDCAHALQAHYLGWSDSSSQWACVSEGAILFDSAELQTVGSNTCIWVLCEIYDVRIEKCAECVTVCQFFFGRRFLSSCAWRARSSSVVWAVLQSLIYTTLRWLLQRDLIHRIQGIDWISRRAVR